MYLLLWTVNLMSGVLCIRLLLVYVINSQVIFGNQVQVLTLLRRIFLTIPTCSVFAFTVYTLSTIN